MEIKEREVIKVNKKDTGGIWCLFYMRKNSKKGD